MAGSSPGATVADRRIWIPDESCEPFLFETVCAVSDVIMGRFAVPSRRLAVLASINLYEHAALDNKRIPVEIVPGVGNPSDAGGTLADILSQYAMTIHGALTGVEEYAGFQFFPGPVPGWQQGSGRVTNIDVLYLGGEASREIRVVLAGGTSYTIHKIQNTLPSYGLSLFGWTFDPLSAAARDAA